MTLSSRLGGVAATLVVASLVLAGCGTRSGELGPSRPASTALPASTAIPAVTTVRKATPTRPQRARLAAARILEQETLPARAHRVARPPSKALDQPATVPADPNLVDLHRFYVADETVPALLAFLRSHGLPGSSLSSEGESGNLSGTYEWDLGFSLPPVGTVLDSRALEASVVSLGARRSGLRIDAQVTWLPAKPAGDVIPPGAKLLAAWLSKGPDPGQPGHRPVTTTNPKLIEAIRQHINALVVQQPGTTACPADFGQLLTLVFRTRPGAAPLAVVKADPAGCGQIVLTRNGHPVKPALRGGGTFVPFAERELGWPPASR